MHKSMQCKFLLLVLMFLLEILSVSGKNLKNVCHIWKYPHSLQIHIILDLLYISRNNSSFISDAGTIDYQGTDGSVNSFSKFEANEDMNYADRMQEERSIFNKILENYFDKTDFDQKLKQTEETIGRIFHILFSQTFS